MTELLGKLYGKRNAKVPKEADRESVALLLPIGCGRHHKNRAPTNQGREAVRAQIKLVRLFGVELGLHYSWLIIAVLIVFSLGDHFHLIHPAWSSTVVRSEERRVGKECKARG